MPRYHAIEGNVEEQDKRSKKDKFHTWNAKQKSSYITIHLLSVYISLGLSSKIDIAGSFIHKKISLRCSQFHRTSRKLAIIPVFVHHHCLPPHFHPTHHLHSHPCIISILVLLIISILILLIISILILLIIAFLWFSVFCHLSLPIMSLDTCLLHLLCHPPSPYCNNICLCDSISYCSLHTQVECGINLALPIHRTKFPQFQLRCTRKTATSLAHHSTFLCSMTPFSLAIISFHSSAVCHIVVFYNLFITLMLFHILIFLIKNFYGIFLLLFLLYPLYHSCYVFSLHLFSLIILFSICFVLPYPAWNSPFFLFQSCNKGYFQSSYHSFLPTLQLFPTFWLRSSFLRPHITNLQFQPCLSIFLILPFMPYHRHRILSY